MTKKTGRWEEIQPDLRTDLRTILSAKGFDVKFADVVLELLEEVYRLGYLEGRLNGSTEAIERASKFLDPESQT